MTPAEKDDKIHQLFDNLADLHSQNDISGAKRVAEELAALLGDPTPECMKWYVHDWALIWEVRGNLEEAIRIQDLDIARKRAELDSGDYDPYPKLLVEVVIHLQDSFYLQAERYDKLGNRAQAIACLREVYALAERYRIGPDEDTIALLAKLRS